QIETLTLASVSIPSGRGGGSVPPSPAPVDEDDDRPPSAPRAPAPAPVARRAPARAAMSAAARRSARRPPGSKDSPSDRGPARGNGQLVADLAAQPRFAPVMDNNGKLRGVALMNVVPDSLIERLGLRSDDVVVAIEGTPIDSSGRAMNVARG